jgi:RHS repeat-associated protein
LLISLTSATPLTNPIGYAGYVYLPDFGTLGHWLARHRIFDPVMGRWITRDPAGYVDGMSLYLYARGNPWMFVDPLGLAATMVGNFLRNVGEAIVSADTFVTDVIGGTIGMAGNKVDAVSADPGGAIRSASIVGQVEAAAQGVASTVQRIDAVATNGANGSPSAMDYVTSGAAVLTGMQDVAEGIASHDVATNTPITDGLDRAGRIAQGVGQGAMLAASGAGAVQGAMAAGASGGAAQAGTAARVPASRALSTYRLTAPGETFVRYESGNPAFSRKTPSGGVTPGTSAAPASDGIIPISSRAQVYNLPSPEIPRQSVFTITPRPGTAIIGPRPVIGGTGNDVIFPFGCYP